MKKYLLLLLLIYNATFAQVNPTRFEKIQVTNNVTDNVALKVNVQGATGIINTISKTDLIDVIEVSSATTLPITGTTGKIYITLDNVKMYRWNGTVYIEYFLSKEDKANKGIENGYASLDVNGKVPLIQINDALLGSVNYKGTYNAATNTPVLPMVATGNKGHYFIVSTAGTQVGLTLQAGDWIISNGEAWGKVDNNNAVTSVNGLVGSVVLTTANVAETANKRYQTDAQQTNNNATSPIQAQINSKQPTITGTADVIPKFGTGGLVSSNITDNGSVITTNTDIIISNDIRIGKGGGTVASNLALGKRALENNSTGSNIIALGDNSLLSNSIGQFNTSIGSQALRGNTSGGMNVAMSYASLLFNSTGSSNIGLGYLAGTYIADGTTSLTNTNNSFFIGSNTKSLANNSLNEIVIGNNATGAGNNSVTLGNTTITKTVLRGEVIAGTSVLSPNLTGIPIAPTAAAGTNTTQLATTAFVLANGASHWTKTGDDISNNNTGNVYVGASATEANFSRLGVKGVGTGDIQTWVKSNGVIGARIDQFGSFTATAPSSFTDIGLSGFIGIVPNKAYNGNSNGSIALISRNTFWEMSGKVDYVQDYSATYNDRSLIDKGYVDKNRLKSYTVATLPAGVQGDTAFVTNALNPTYLSTVVGGGTVVTPVFYNGTNWVSH